MKNGLDSIFRPLSQDEENAFNDAVICIVEEAKSNRHKRPKVTTAIEEFSEMILSFRGKHDDPPELELIQLSSVCINILWQLKMGTDINNIITYR